MKTKQIGIIIILLSTVMIVQAIGNPVFFVGKDSTIINVDINRITNDVQQLCSTPKARNYKNITSLNLAGNYIFNEFQKTPKDSVILQRYIEEEDYLISFYDFLDFYTSNNFEFNINFIKENFEENLIHNYNVGSEINEITFKTEEGSGALPPGT